MNNKLDWKAIQGKELIITQTGSTIGGVKSQIASVKGLGLRKIGSISKLKAKYPDMIIIHFSI